MSKGQEGTAWSDAENDMVVADYFAMLTKELTGQPFVKSHHNQTLAELIGRSKKSIEYKHMNISAVLERLGLPRIKGYAPLANFQGSLIAAIERHIANDAKTQSLSSDASANEAVRSRPALWIGPAPTISPEDRKTTDALERLVRKFDPAARDERNRRLGRSGEEMVFHHEREALIAAGRDDLARKVEWTSQERGDGAGYDIASFAANGSPRLIEVKTTNGPAKTPFYVSENERLFSEERPDAFRLMRLHDFSTKPSGFELRPPLEEFLALQPTSYRASLR
ncbi:DUF3883 domain-containing protein [Sphingopyxis sp. MWB1]|uniref:DUF3883 domain-containing protein n=1 Tax=Sphingopyxis sp. MWB1 TaxID=1537715 RepID=UPI00051A6E9A|nr:DUF3883 domain-containing protein [Sphingopyxis sp. MWB1]